MITISGSGNITQAPELRTSTGGKPVTTVSVACPRRKRDEPPLYVDLVLWEAQAEAAVKHLVKGQAVSFVGHPELNVYKRNDGEPGAKLKVNDVELEYGSKPRERQPEQEMEPAAA